MTSQELHLFCRTKLDDLIGVVKRQSLFSVDELYSYISDVQERIASECLLLRRSVPLTLEAGDSEVARPVGLLRIDELRYSRGLTKKRLKQSTASDVPIEVASGDPSYYELDSNPDAIVFDRAPAEAAALIVRGRFMPQDRVAKNKEIEVPAQYHHRFVNGVLAQAFLKPDTESYNPQKAAGYNALFARDIEEIKRMELRLNGRRARMIT